MIASTATATASAPDRSASTSDAPTGDAAAFAALLAVLLPQAGPGPATTAPAGTPVTAATVAATASGRSADAPAANVAVGAGTPDAAGATPRPVLISPAAVTPVPATPAVPTPPTPTATPTATATTAAVPATPAAATPTVVADEAAPAIPRVASTAPAVPSAVPTAPAVPAAATTVAATDPAIAATVAVPPAAAGPGADPKGAAPRTGDAAPAKRPERSDRTGQPAPAAAGDVRPAEPTEEAAHRQPATVEAAPPAASLSGTDPRPAAHLTAPQVGPDVRPHDAAPVNGASTPAPVRPASAPLPPHSQVASLVAGLRRESDGAYRLTLRLHPDELGPVHVEVELRGGEVALHLDAESGAARAALRDSLGDLRAELEAGGLHTRSLDVADRGPGNAFHDRAPAPQPAAPRNDATAADGDQAPLVPPVTTARPADAAVDLRL